MKVEITNTSIKGLTSGIKAIILSINDKIRLI
jgi:hypothetical protein